MSVKMMKLLPSDAAKIRAKRAREGTKQSLSSQISEVLKEYGDGRAQPAKTPERYTQQIAVYGDEIVFARASERAKREKRPIGEVIAEALLGDER